MQTEIENVEKYGIYKIYLKLVDVWLDKMEKIITIEDGNKKIELIIAEMNIYLEQNPDEKFFLKMFFINGEGWKNFHPFDVLASGNFKSKIIALRTGTERFLSPDVDMLGLEIEEGTAEDVLQEILNKTSQYRNVTPEDLERDYAELKEMETLAQMMEENLYRETQNFSSEDKLMEDLLENEEVKKIYQNTGEEKVENQKMTEEEVVKETTKEAEEELKEEAQKTEEDIKEENKNISLSVKIVAGLAVTAVVVGVGYLLKNKFLK